MQRKRSIEQWIFDFATLCLVSLLIITISSLFVSNPPLSKIHGQVSDNDTTPSGIIAPDDNTTRPLITVPHDDRTPPVINIPDDITEQATNPNGAQVTYTVTAEDNVDGPADVEISCDHNSGDTFSIGETVVTCTAEDFAGNVGEGSFLITVEPLDGDTLGGGQTPINELEGGEGGVTTVLPSAEAIPSLINAIPLILLAAVVLGGITLGVYKSKQSRSSRKLKIPSSAIVEIRTKGGTRE